MLSRHNKHWSKSEDHFICQNYGKVSLTALSKELGRTYQSVRGRAMRLGIAKNFPMVAELNGNWKGGYSFLRSGYKKNNKTDKLYHREVVEQRIKRALTSQEIIHHIDGDKANNESHNLYLCDNMSNHRHVHASLERIAFSLVRAGTILFDDKTGKYFLTKEAT